MQNRVVISRSPADLYSLIESLTGDLTIVSFQFTDEELSRLHCLLDKDRRRRIVTLPVDSYRKEEKRQSVECLHARLRAIGVEVLYVPWEVGEPSLTGSSLSGRLQAGGGDKWYAFHGKLVVASDGVIVTSSNFDGSVELQSHFAISDPNLVRSAVELTNRFVSNFTGNVSQPPGLLLEDLPEADRDEIVEFWSESSRTRWLVKDYPLECIGKEAKHMLSRGVYLSPFGVSARALLQDSLLVNAATVDLVTERLFDDELVGFLCSQLPSRKGK